MSGSKRGLVAPQNTFLETIIRRSSGQRSSILLANARIVDFPVVFVNESFSRLTGFSRAEVMQRSGQCMFLCGPDTGPPLLARWETALVNCEHTQLEIILYKKNKTPIWVLLQIFPVKNEQQEIILLLLNFRDVTAIKQPIDEESENKAGLSKFAKLAKSVTRNRSVRIEMVQDVSEDSAHKSDTMKSEGYTNSGFSAMNVPQYKHETPRTPPHIILHYSNFKVIWDWVILLLTYYTAVMVPFNVAFSVKSLDTIVLLIVDSTVDVVFFLDIVLNFHTTLVGSSGEVVSDAALIRINYLKSWFVVDLMSCLPYDAFSAFQPHSQDNKSLRRTQNSQEISQLFSALKVVRLLRIGRVLRKLDQYLEYMATMLGLMIFLFLLVAHWFACVWYTVGVSDLRAGRRFGWIPKMIQDSSVPGTVANLTMLDLTTGNKLKSYVTSLYFTMSLLTSIGFGNVNANTEMEKTTCVVFMLVGALIYATVFGNVTTILHQMYATKARYQDTMNNIRDFIRIHSVPEELGERVVDYVASSWAITKGVNTEQVLNYCPKDMKADLSVHLNRMVFNSHLAFRLASDGCLRALAVHFSTLHTAPGDLIFHQGESIDQLCFVVSGSLEVIQDDEVIAIMGKGDVFGDNMWKERSLGQSASTVRVLTYCNLHCIKRDALLSVLGFYTAFSNSFERNLVLTVNLRNRFVFRKLCDASREKELNNQLKEDKVITRLSPEHPVRKLISKFKKFKESNKLSEDDLCENSANRSRRSDVLGLDDEATEVFEEMDQPIKRRGGKVTKRRSSDDEDSDLGWPYRDARGNRSSAEHVGKQCSHCETCRENAECLIFEVKQHFQQETEDMHNHMRLIDNKLGTILNVLNSSRELRALTPSSSRPMTTVTSEPNPESSGGILKSIFPGKRYRGSIAPSRDKQTLVRSNDIRLSDNTVNNAAAAAASKIPNKIIHDPLTKLS